MNLNDKINILIEKANLENKVRKYNLKCFHTKNEALKYSETIKFIKHLGFVAITEECIIGRNKSIYKSTEASNKDLYDLLKTQNYDVNTIKSSIVDFKIKVQDLIKDISMTKKQREFLITNLAFVNIATNDFKLIEDSYNKLNNISTQTNFGIFLHDLSDNMKMKNKDNVKKLYEDLLEEHEIQKLLKPEQLEEYKNVKIILMFNDNGDLTTNNEDAKLAWMMPLDRHGNPKSECNIEKIVGKNCGNEPNSNKTKYMLMLRPYNMNNKQTTHVVITVDKNKNIIEILGNANTDVNFGKYGKQLMFLFTETDYIDLGIDSSKLKDLSNIALDELTEINNDIVKEKLIDKKIKLPNFNIDDFSFEEIYNMKYGYCQTALIKEKIKSPNFNIDNVSFEEIINIKDESCQTKLIEKKIESPNFNIDEVSLEDIYNIEDVFSLFNVFEKKIKSPNFNIDEVSLEDIFNMKKGRFQTMLLNEKAKSSTFNIDNISFKDIYNIKEGRCLIDLIKKKLKSPNFNIDKVSLEEIINMPYVNYQEFLIDEKVKSPNFNIDVFSFEEITNNKYMNVQTSLINEKMKSPNFNIDDVSFEDIDNIKDMKVQTSLIEEKMKSPNFNIDDFSLEEIDNIKDMTVQTSLIDEKVKSPNFNIDVVSFEDISNFKNMYCQAKLFSIKIESPNFNINDVSLEDIDKIDDNSIIQHALLRLKNDKNS